MKELNGRISDKLRRQFSSSDSVWNPVREEDVIGDSIPSHVQGIKMGSRKVPRDLA